MSYGKCICVRHRWTTCGPGEFTALQKANWPKHTMRQCKVLLLLSHEIAKFCDTLMICNEALCRWTDKRSDVSLTCVPHTLQHTDRFYLVPVANIAIVRPAKSCAKSFSADRSFDISNVICHTENETPIEL